MSFEIFSIARLAASLPPRPNARPKAIARPAINPVNNICMNAAAIPSSDNAIINANIQIAYLVIDPSILAELIFAAFADVSTSFFIASAITVAIIKTKAAMITFGK